MEGNTKKSMGGGGRRRPRSPGEGNTRNQRKWKEIRKSMGGGGRRRPRCPGEGNTRNQRNWKEIRRNQWGAAASGGQVPRGRGIPEIKGNGRKYEEIHGVRFTTMRERFPTTRGPVSHRAGWGFPPRGVRFPTARGAVCHRAGCGFPSLE